MLALILFNLAHAPTPAVAYYGFAFAGAAVIHCGEDSPDDQSSYAPCHACRVGGDAVLPPPPCDSEQILLKAVPVIYSPTIVVPQDDLRSIANRSRGPPLHA